jgi:hypothetical protein
MSDSAAKVVRDENQSSTIEVRSRFLIILTRLRTRSAELLVTASDARIQRGRRAGGEGQGEEDGETYVGESRRRSALSSIAFAGRQSQTSHVGAAALRLVTI